MFAVREFMVRGVVVCAVLTTSLGCGGDTTPEEEETVGEETEVDPNAYVAEVDDPNATSESEAVAIAFQAAEAEGHDTANLTDVVVHSNDSNQWEVSLRQPMRTRFLRVMVDKRTGAADVQILQTGH